VSFAVLENLRRMMNMGKDKAAKAQQTAPNLADYMPQELIGLFYQAASCTSSGNSEGRRIIVSEILKQFANDVEVSKVGYEGKTIHIRPLPPQVRYSLLCVVKLDELDEDIAAIAEQRCQGLKVTLEALQLH
jgi:hypothetical protein